MRVRLGRGRKLVTLEKDAMRHLSSQNSPWGFSILRGRIFLQGLGSVRRTILFPLRRISLTGEICSRSLHWPCSSLRKSWKKLQEGFPPPWLADALGRDSHTCLSLSHLVRSRTALIYSAAMPCLWLCLVGLDCDLDPWDDFLTGLSPFGGEATASACHAVIPGFQILFSLLKSNCLLSRETYEIHRKGEKIEEVKCGASVPVASFSQGSFAYPATEVPTHT